MPLGNVRWLGGLRGDSAGSDSAVEDAFVFAEHDFEPGERLDLGADGRSSEQFVPFFLVDDGRDEFFGGLMWSGAWRASLERADDQLRVGVSFPGVGHHRHARRSRSSCRTRSSASPPRPRTDETGALRQFVLQGIRHGRPFQPLVTYNTWFVYGTRAQRGRDGGRDGSRGRARRRALRHGRRLVSGRRRNRRLRLRLRPRHRGPPIPTAFRPGLASLADYAHGVGMKFGLWVEPERVSLATVDKAGLAQEAVARDARRRLRLRRSTRRSAWPARRDASG